MVQFDGRVGVPGDAVASWAGEAILLLFDGDFLVGGEGGRGRWSVFLDDGGAHHRVG